MIRFVFRQVLPLCLVALSFLGAGCGRNDGDGSKEKANNGLVPAVNVDDVSKWAKENSQKAIDNGQKALDETGALAKRTFNDAISSCQDDARYLLNKAGSGAESGLGYLSVPPGEKPAVEKQAIRFAAKSVPALRGVVRYADARQTWAAAEKLSDPKAQAAMRQTAKRECLLACLHTGLDVTSLGTTGMVDQAAGHASNVLKVLEQGQKIGAYASFAPADPLAPCLDAALTVPTIDYAMEVLVSVELSKIGDLAVGAK